MAQEELTRLRSAAQVLRHRPDRVDTLTPGGCVVAHVHLCLCSACGAREAVDALWPSMCSSIHSSVVDV